MNSLKEQLQRELNNACAESGSYSISLLDESTIVVFELYETPFKSLLARCYAPKDYPSSLITVDLESATIPPVCLEKMLSLCNNEIQKLQASESQVARIYTVLTSILKSNKLLLCVPDLEAIKENFLKGANDKLTVSEKKGTINLHVEENDFSTDFLLKVPSNYPHSQVEVECHKSSFCDSVTKSFVAQATDIARRCSQGSINERSPSSSMNAIGDDKSKEQLTISQYRHDIKFLKERNAYATAATDRRSRRSLARFEKTESNRENELLKEKLVEPKVKEQNISKPRAGLLPVAQFLIFKFVKYLPHLLCAFCNESLATMFKIEAKNPPEKSLCGHWFHPSCLETAMKTPPFGKECPAKDCKSAILTPKWNSESQLNERRWAMEEAHKREKEEIRDFLDF